MNQKLKSSENILIGNWIFQNNKVVSDNIGKRIDYLTENSLKKLVSSEDGWSTLYIDLDDIRYWEKIYPNSELQGGGAPTLKSISKQEAIDKYPEFKD
jgi:hypothetical protein